ncbi:DUF3280 domain-containing protein [Methylocella tundrae]|uniref:DUF2380 domain-containing protein n=1 Tax=Methylocella tundrae TaxID=227605 RepID=A0A4U8Z5R7_METTU|nr:DUF3280 domain-containing protein [Methylocella tundrae]WPP04487.1 DUF3280 domain-containing protein [Methylocella tundrae]VFU10878.1 conserved exported protein of unknown function [Methylocella tundrae]
MWAGLRFGLAALALMMAAAGAVAQTNKPQPLAVFPVELWDTSGEGAKPHQAERLEHATATLAKALEQDGRYRAVDLSPYRDEIAKTEPRYNCNGCWREIARKAGAQFAALATVHKVSSLISSFDITITNLETGKAVAYASGQFRGDDDEAYTRAVKFLVKDRLSSAGAQGAAAQ